MEQHIKDKENELRLLLNLRSAGNQKKLKEHLLNLQIKVIAKNGEKSADGNQHIYQVMGAYIKDNDDMTGSPFDVRATATPVYQLLGYIKAIKNCRIVDICLTDQSSTDIHIICLSSVAIEDVIKSINCNEFQQKLYELKPWLYLQYNLDSHDIIANCSSNDIEKANQSLHFTDITRNMTCAKHQSTQCTLYCPDHDTFFCTACRESKHGTCHGIKQVISGSSYVQHKHRLTIKGIEGSYNVKLGNTMKINYHHDQNGCEISCMCMLPNGEILLADFMNKRLKKLVNSSNAISYCDVTEHPYSVCYIGNDTAIAGLWPKSIQYVNVSGYIKLKQLVKLDHACLGLACHGDTLYVNSGDTIYKYDKYCKQKQVICHYRNDLHMFYKNAIAISDNGERLYFRKDTNLITIDAEGNHIFSSQFGCRLHDICIAGEGIVLVLDEKHSVHLLDYNGKEMHGHVNDVSFSISGLQSMCFDRERFRLIVGGIEDKIHVYKCEVLQS